MAERFRMTAYTGAVINSGWWGKTVIDLTGIWTEGKLPALREHRMDRAVGVIDTISKTKDLLASGYFVDTRDGREVKALLSEGFPYQASIGCYPDRIEEVRIGDTAAVNGSVFTGPGVVIRSSHVREISFVSLGADAGTSVEKIAASASLGMQERGPEDFNAAVLQLLEEGIPVGDTVKLAATRWPDLYRAYCRRIVGVEE